ncbi:unnamed protein product, partial [Effrenium voratum]
MAPRVLHLACAVALTGPAFVLRRAAPSSVEVPATYAEQFAGVLPDDFSWEDFLEASQRPVRPCVRVNSLRGGCRQRVQRLGALHGWRLGAAVPWGVGGFWVQQVNVPSLEEEEELPAAWAKMARKKVQGRAQKIPARPEASRPAAIGWGSDPAFVSGQVYVQEASSLLPVAALLDAFQEPPEGLRVLDMAAAPGGKTTALCAWLAGKGAVVANEPNVARCKALVENLLRTGSAPHAAVTQMDGRQCGKLWPGHFDAVLLDAPCSGESLTRRGEAEALAPKPQYVEGLSKLQRQLISSAFQALKVGGVLVYSTCTLNVKENEEVCSYLLDAFPGAVEREALDLPGTEKMRTSDGFLRCWPQICDTQGFFVARFRKTADVSGSAEAEPDTKRLERLSEREAAAVQRAFESAFGLKVHGDLQRSGGEVWLCPEALSGLRFSGPRRCGIRLALTRRQGLAYPAHHEWVMSFGHEVPEDGFGVAELSRDAAKDFCAGQDVEPLWTPAAAVAEEGEQ